MRNIIIILLAVAFSSISATSVLSWDYIENDKFTVFYPEGYRFQAEEVLKYSDNHYDHVRDLTGNEKEFKTRIVIQDPGNVPNGNADFVNMKINIFTHDPTSLESFANDNWFRIVGVHELVHISQLSNYSGAGAILPFLFGNQYSSNMAMPMWIVEGITVFTESTITPYEGRMNYGYYSAIVSAKAAENKLPNVVQAQYWDKEGLRGQYYTYGGAFFKFLSEKYGKEKIGEFFKLNGSKFLGSLSMISPMLSLDGSAKSVFGKTLPQLFEEWHNYEIENAKTWKITGLEVDIRQDDTYELSRLQSHDGNIYFCRTNLDFSNYYTEIVKFNPKKAQIEIVKTFPGSLIGNIEIKDGKLYYGLQELRLGFANLAQSGKGIIGVIYELDLESGKEKKILKANFTDFAVTDSKTIIFVESRTDYFGSNIYEFNGELKKLHELDRKISEIIINGREFYTVDKSMIGSWDISKFDINSGRLSPLLNSPWQETRIKLENGILYYTANYESKYNAYSLDLETLKKHCLSKSSFAADGVESGDSLYFIAITSEGERLYSAKTEKNLYDKELPKAYYPNETMPKIEKEGNAFCKNLKYFFLPSSRFNLMNINGEDGIGYNSYSLSFESADSNDIDVNFSWTTQIFNPITLTFTAEKLRTDKDFTLEGSLPLYQSLRSGLNNVSLIYLSDLRDDVQPGMRIGYGFSKIKSNFSGYYDVNSEGYFATGSIAKYFSKCNITLSGNYYEDIDATPSLSGGDFDEIKLADGYEAELKLNFRLMKIRNGLWNPNIGFGDLDGAIYSQYSKLEKTYKSVGAEMSLDVGALWLMNLKVVSGVNYFDEEVNPYFNIRFGY